MPAISNISIARISDVIGQFVTPQNTLTMPQAAQSPAGRPKNPDKKCRYDFTALKATAERDGGEKDFQ